MHHHRIVSKLTAVLLALGSFACGSSPATGDQALSDRVDTRTEIQLPGTSYYPEGIASTRDGTFYVGSMGTGAIVRVPPHALGTESFVPARSAFAVYGLAVDEAHGIVWACTWDDNLPSQPSHLTGYAVATGAMIGTYPMPAADAACNDVTVDAAGNVYATDSFGNAVVKLPVGGTALITWATDPRFAPTQQWNFTLNGIAMNPQGNALYVVKYDTGNLFSIPIQADGSAGTAVEIPVVPAISSPDGLEVIDANTLLVMENGGDVQSVSTVKLSGGSGQKTVINSSLDHPTNAVISGSNAWVVESQQEYLSGAPGSPTLPFRVVRVPLP